MRYMRKAVEIEAEVYDGTREMAERLARWVDDPHSRAPLLQVNDKITDTLYTLYLTLPSGRPVVLAPGDALIKGEWGEFYEVSKETFATHYGPVPL